jgi:hypothetical protein
MCSIRLFIITLLGIFTFGLSPLTGLGQTCSGLFIQVKAEESRCTATGSMLITVTGGSDNYSYRVIGPVTTPFTSSSYITGLRPGTYDVEVVDLENGCNRIRRGVIIAGDYVTPSVTFTGIPVSCKNAPNGEIRLASLSNGRSPFNFTLTAAPVAAFVGKTSTDGNFTGLPAGNYTVQMEDSCNGLQTRVVSVPGYDWFMEAANVTNSGCGEVSVQVVLKDNQGKSTPDPVFSTFTYGWVRGDQDTVWHNNPGFTLAFGTRRSVRVVAKDGCGNNSFKDVSITTSLSINAVVTKLQTGCNQFTAQIGSFSNFQQPEFCLFNSNNQQISCNTTGSFTQLSSGNYVMRVRELCYDTTILVPFTLTESKPTVSEQVIVERIDCGYFSARVQGLSGWNSPQFCIYNGTMLEYCNTTGNFGYLRNGLYRLEIKDGCYDTTIVRTVEMSGQKPTASGVQIENLQCQSLDARVIGTANLTNPQYLLFFNNSFVFSNSTGYFMDLGYGDYEVRIVNDPACYDTTIVLNFSARKPIPSVSSKFNVAAGCTTADLEVTGQQNLTNPQYCLYNAADSLIQCNTSGVFRQLPFGPYCVKIKNDPSCYDTTIVVCETIERPIPDVGIIEVTTRACSVFSIRVTGMEALVNPIFTLKNEAGIVIGTNNTGIFTNVPYGRYCMDMDNNLVCNDTVITRCFTVEKPKPSGGTVDISNRTCSGYTVTVGGMINVSNPLYVFKNQTGTILDTNNSGVFNVQGYFPYCIEIKNDTQCYDTTLIICQNPPPQPAPSSRGPLVFNQTCSTFSVRLLDVGAVTNPVYQLLQNNTIIASAAVPRFDNVPYGSYTFRLLDGCYPVPLNYAVVATRTAADMLLTAVPGCTNNKTNIRVDITGGTAPFSITVYDPMNNVAGFVQTSSTSYLFADLSPLTAGLMYRVDLSDQCGTRKEATVSPVIASTTSTYEIIQKCPTGASPSGVSALEVSAQSNVGAVIPTIIRRDGQAVQMPYETTRNEVFIWSALTPATYVIEYAAGTCTKTYDTVVVAPYTMPQLGQSAIYQCSNSTFSISTTMSGGALPYQYQIVSSQPLTPSIATGWQSSPVFSISGSQPYSLVRLRGIDACGNASLDDAGVLPPEQLALSVSGNCFNSPVTLSANKVANASYTWYKVNGQDSIILGTDAFYAIPELTRNDTGVYVVKMNVNAGCYVREVSYRLTGTCVMLEVNSIVLSGRKIAKTGELNFVVTGERRIKGYEIERSVYPDKGFVQIGKLDPQSGSLRSVANYRFVDQGPSSGRNFYRIRVVDLDGRIQYSNVIDLTWFDGGVKLYPNPARQAATVSIQQAQPEEITIQLLSSSGQMVYQQRLVGGRQLMVTIPRMNLASGLYMVRISGLRSGFTHMEKLIFE